jgi:hypothetical protein
MYKHPELLQGSPTQSQFFNNSKKEIEQRIKYCSQYNFPTLHDSTADSIYQYYIRNWVQGYYAKIAFKIVDCKNQSPDASSEDTEMTEKC